MVCSVKHYALRVCLAADYEALADYIQYRQEFLLGGENEALKRRIKYQLSSCSNKPSV